MEIHPGTFENLAKMTRIGSTSAAISTLPSNILCSLVRTRTVHPPSAPTSGPEPRLRSMFTDSDTDTPRPRSYRSYQGRPTDTQRLFYREPFPDGLPVNKEPSVDERADIERWRNKQWHREKLLGAGKEMLDEGGMEKRRRVYTRRERDQMRQMRGHQHYGETMSDVDYSEHRFRDGSKRETRSGYSTPGSISNDELKLGRNMRAAPRHLVDSRDRVRSVPAVRDKLESGVTEPLLSASASVPVDAVVGYHTSTHPTHPPSSSPPSQCVGVISPQHPSQELIEQLNRQQQLLQQQREQRRRFLEGQKLHDPSPYGGVRSGSATPLNDGRISREDVRQIKNQLNDAHLYGGDGGSLTPNRKVESGTLTPKSEVDLQSGTSTPAIDQILKEGRVSVQSEKQSEHSASRPPEHSTDFFDSNRVSGEGLFQYEESSEKKYMDEEKEDNDKLVSGFQQLQSS